MNNAPAILKSLVVYAVCVPLAVFIGYLLSNPLDYSTAAIYGVLGGILLLPILLRWHYLLLLLSFNLGAYMFFLKGRPDFWLVMVVLSLGISMVERALNSEMRFIRVPQITWPLLCLLGVVYLTAKLTGGFGLRSYGSEVMGGKKYIYLVAGILGYFALTARRIPSERVGLYFGLFMLSGLANIIGDLYSITPSFLHFIFWMFPPNGYAQSSFEVGLTRLSGIASAAYALLYWFVAKNGLRGIFLSGKIWRMVLFVLLSILGLLGGFRLTVLSYIFIMGTLFVLEKMYRTRVMPAFVMVGMVMVVTIIPLAPHLPFTVQRALSILPLNVSYEARQTAEASSEWRIKMWRALLPQVPSYLLLGKGYALTKEDFEFMGGDSAFRTVDASQQGLALSSDFHNGPLSVVIPFGLWGIIAVLWFIIAGLWVTYCNFRYGDAAFQTINTFLLANFLYLSARFLFVFGGLNSDMITFVGTIGFSIALNGGVRQRALQTVQVKKPPTLAKPFPRPRPVFQR